MFDYLREPEAIYQRSFDLVKAETDLSDIPADLNTIAIRLVHACAMPDIVDDLTWHGQPQLAGRQALQQGSLILCDCEMLRQGIIRSRLSNDNAVICTLNEPEVAELARQHHTTRSAAAIDLWQPYLAGAVVAIGNAPTALFRLLELLLTEQCHKPAAIFAFPVGFVGAAESKDALINCQLNIPFLTLRGRRGGSALAAAAINALS